MSAKKSFTKYDFLGSPPLMEMEGCVIYTNEEVYWFNIGRCVYCVRKGVNIHSFYELSDWKASSAYLAGVARRINDETKGDFYGIKFKYSDASKYTTLADYLDGPESNTHCSIKEIRPTYGDAVWIPNKLFTGQTQMGKNSNTADDLMSLLSGKDTATPVGPNPSVPESRVEEAPVGDDRIPPHRRSVVRGLRTPKDYIAHLMK
jgi:hypothetical protein